MLCHYCTKNITTFYILFCYIFYFTMICIHCSKIAKYKCPKCRTPYCSVSCYKIHKATPCSPPAPLTSKPAQDSRLNVNYDYPTEDTVSLERLKLLDESKEVQKCLENPHVRQILEELDQSPNPDTIIKEYMQEPIFTEFVDACLNIVQDKEN